MASARIIERIRKVLALTTSPDEGEAAAASEMLQQLLTKHNLEIADLEQHGQEKPKVGEATHDVGKRPYVWKLQLASDIAGHYFCVPIVDFHSYRVKFVGRPDNVESLRMLYDWLVDQIIRIGAEERKRHLEETGENIHQVRWQRSFGEGAAYRLQSRISTMSRQTTTTSTTALVVSLNSENSDYLEEHYGYRIDGKPTKQELKWKAEREEKRRYREECEATGRMEEYYNKYYWERPLTPEQRAKQIAENEEYQRKCERMARARRARQERMEDERYYNGETYREERAREEKERAYEAGKRAAENINLHPFVTGGKREQRPELT